MEISASAKDMIEQLDKLVQVGFHGRQEKKVSEMIAGVRLSEHNIDSILSRAKSILFENE